MPNTSDTTTLGIRIEVASSFIPERSSEAQKRFFFAYHIRITNLRDSTTQLISRHWIICDGHGRTEEVQGPGVIGEQPILSPGASFEYTSFCPLPTPIGSMHGTYQMLDLDTDSPFTALIASFTLASPLALN
jgi:ApaG protein